MISRKTFERITIVICLCVFYFLGLAVCYYSTKCSCPAGNYSPAAFPKKIRLVNDTIHLNRATTYQPTTDQCAGNPFSTADGSIINPDNFERWVALSRDLLKRWGGEFAYGDTIEIYSKSHSNLNGYWVVHDCMNAKYKMSIDFLLEPEKNYPKLGVGTDVKIITCGNESL